MHSSASIIHRAPSSGLALGFSTLSAQGMEGGVKKKRVRGSDVGGRVLMMNQNSAPNVRCPRTFNELGGRGGNRRRPGFQVDVVWSGTEFIAP